MDQSVDRYCSECGESLVPLEVPHLSAECATCHRRKFFVRPGEGGIGIKIEAGESFTIPADFLRLSFDPTMAHGRLQRPGVPFLLQRLFVAGMSTNPDEFVAGVTAWRDSLEKDLWASDKLAGIDPTSPSAGDQAIDRLKGEQGSHEWHMWMKDLNALLATESVKANDASKAAHFGLWAGIHHGLSIVTQPYFEEMVWRGYLAGIAIHEAGNAADHVPGEVEALNQLDMLFHRVGEANLQTWVDSGVPIGQRIGVSSISEPLLVARAKWHLQKMKQSREDEVRKSADRRAGSELRLKWVQFLVTAVGSSGMTALILKYVG